MGKHRQGETERQSGITYAINRANKPGAHPEIAEALASGRGIGNICKG